MSVLDPLAGLRIDHLYAQFGSVVDFALYTTLFVGLAQTTLGKRFAGKGVTVGIGTLLALGLTLAQKNIGFSIANFGPIAAGVVVAMVSLFLYGLLRSFEVDRISAALSAAAATYVGIALYSPGIVDWLSATAPEIAAGMVLVTLLAVVTLAVRFWRSWVGGSSMTKEDGRLISETAKAEMESDRAGDLLRQVIKTAQKEPSRENARQALHKLELAAPLHNRMTRRLEVIGSLLNRMRRADLRVLNELQSLPEAQRKRVHGKILGKIKELRIDGRLGRLRTAAQTYARHFESGMAAAIKAASDGRQPDLLEALRQCAKAEAFANRNLDRMKELERDLRRAASK